MNSTALYQALIDAGVSKDGADKASADVAQMAQLSELATKNDMSNMETRLVKWMVAYGLLLAGALAAIDALIS